MLETDQYGFQGKNGKIVFKGRVTQAEIELDRAKRLQMVVEPNKR